MNTTVLTTDKRECVFLNINDKYKPAHIQHLGHTQNMLSGHYKVIFDLDHASAGRKRVKEMCEIYLE